MGHVLDNIFKPRSVAVIGASEVPGKAAERRTRSLIRDGYPGEVYLINPKRDRLFDRKAYPSILDVEGPVDLVMIVVASKFIPQAVEDSVRKGAKGIVVITAGLGETGEEGKRIEARILRTAEEAGAKIVGPNCSGLFSAAAGMNLLGVPTIKKGPLAIIAQSGNIIDSLTHYSELRGLGCSGIISAGNAIGVQFHEYLEYLGQDEATKVILMYMEGIKHGGELVRVAREVSKHKPIIALKVGRFSAGARAAASHTGSLAADDTVVEAALRQAGIIRVTNVDEMFDLAVGFAGMPLPRGRNVAIVSEGGGDNSVAADNAESYGMAVPVLDAETQARIRPFLLAGMPASNPVDYGGTAEENPDMINKTIEVLMQTDEVDSVYVTGFFGGFRDIIAPHVGELEERTSMELVRLMQTHGKPLAVHSSFANEPYRSMQILKENGVFLTPSSSRAAQCLAAMGHFSDNRQKILNDRPLEVAGTDPRKAAELITAVRRAGRKNFLETEAMALLACYGMAVPTTQLAENPAEAVAAAEAVGYPVAMKIVSPDIIHKSDVGGVALNLAAPPDVENTFRGMIRQAESVTARDRILGVLVTPMARRGQECIIGMVRNPSFGPVLMFGLGGIFVEVLKDVAFRVIPPTRLDVEEMIREIKGYPLLAGIRGQAAKDIGALREILARVARMAVEHPEISEIDINPVIIHEQGASMVDARIILE